MVVLRAYLGETSNHAVARLPPERQKKSNLKYTLFFVTFLASTLCNAVGPGLHLSVTCCISTVYNM